LRALPGRYKRFARYAIEGLGTGAGLDATMKPRGNLRSRSPAGARRLGPGSLWAGTPDRDGRGVVHYIMDCRAAVECRDVPRG